MKTRKRGLTSLLAALMLVSLLPVTALAEGLEGAPMGTPPETEVSETGGESVPVPETEADEVIYNLLDAEITVGSDESRAEEPGYALFDGEGNYVIPLEDNAFFPYQVQFTWDGETWEEWFMDPEDTVEVGGHVFSVTSEQTDPTALTQIGVWMGDDYIPAYPEEKEFTSEPRIIPFSLLPLEEKDFNLNLEGYLSEELSKMKVSTIIAQAEPNYSSDTIAVDPNDLVVWAKGFGNDDYAIVKQDGTIDLAPDNQWDNYLTLELIVGTADQLDINNIRYTVAVQISSQNDILSADAFTEDNTAITLLDDQSEYYPEYYYDQDGNPTALLLLWVDATAPWTGGNASIKLIPGTDFSGLTMVTYTGYYSTAEELKAAVEAGASKDVTASMGEGQNGYLSDYTEYDSQALTTLWYRGEISSNDLTTNLVAVKPMYIRMRKMGDSCNPLYSIYNAQNKSVGSWEDSQWEDGVQYYKYRLTCNLSVSDTYYLRMHYSYNGEYVEDAATYVKSYCGVYGSMEEAEADNQEDITAQLFGEKGYGADYSAGQSFSVFRVADGSKIRQFEVSLLPYETQLPAEPEPNDEEDTYFHADSASASSGEAYDYDEYNVWSMPGDMDGYYFGYPDGELNYGCQTIFLLDDDSAAVTDSTIYPKFTTGNGVKAYLEHGDGESAVEQTSEVSSVAFESGKALAYSASSGSTRLKNYWVTFVTQQSGPKLYVNAANVEDTKDENGNLTREVYLDAYHDYHHDVFFANIGDQALTGLSVKLLDAKNVRLDEYWTIREDSVGTLAAFDSVQESQMDNIAKIRLEPIRNEEGQVQEGEVSGTLVIKADMKTEATSDDQEIRIKLVGTAGQNRITTETIDSGVKYVPYASVIQTNLMGTSDGVSFSLLDGTLPEGIELFENGILYGVPKVRGTFTFTVVAHFDSTGETDSKEFTLVIQENTDANVEATNEDGYELLDRVPDMRTYSEQVFRSEGEIGQFVDFYLDGEKLEKDVDYTANEGSTRITIRAQTFRDAGTGTHTIAAEFRTDMDDPSTLKSTAQNYTISTGSGSGGGSSDDDDDDDNSTTVTRPEQPEQPEQPQQPVEETPQTAADVFTDVSASDWFYPDVDWAYQNELMIGVGNDLYLPGGMISSATVVTVLARMDNVDQSQYAGASAADIEAGQWYSAAAHWARAEGILPDGPFSANPPIARAQVAVMLVNYLERAGIDCTLTGEPMTFADADLMSEEENAAFQVLYQFGIFKGVGEYRMDPLGSTTRAQLAALTHRLSVFIENQV